MPPMLKFLDTALHQFTLLYVEMLDIASVIFAGYSGWESVD